jgi:hypothetical protein
MWLSELLEVYRMDLGKCDRLCADFSGGFLQVMSIATGMTGSNGPSSFASARTALALHHRLNVCIDRAGDPDAGLIVE